MPACYKYIIKILCKRIQLLLYYSFTCIITILKIGMFLYVEIPLCYMKKEALALQWGVNKNLLKSSAQKSLIQSLMT